MLALDWAAATALGDEGVSEGTLQHGEKGYALGREASRHDSALVDPREWDSKCSSGTDGMTELMTTPVMRFFLAHADCVCQHPTES
jgi:hypothetical protein